MYDGQVASHCRQHSLISPLWKDQEQAPSRAHRACGTTESFRAFARVTFSWMAQEKVTKENATPSGLVRHRTPRIIPDGVRPARHPCRAFNTIRHAIQRMSKAWCLTPPGSCSVLAGLRLYVRQLLLRCSTSGIHALALCVRRQAASMRPPFGLSAPTDHRRSGAPVKQSSALQARRSNSIRNTRSRRNTLAVRSGCLSIPQCCRAVVERGLAPLPLIFVDCKSSSSFVTKITSPHPHGRFVPAARRRAFALSRE